MANAATDHVKRLQSRATRAGFRRTMADCRKAYAVHVQNPAYPTEEEMAAALQELTTVEQPLEEIPGDLAIQQPETIEIPSEQPDIWETLQPPQVEEALDVCDDVPPQVEEQPSEQTSAALTTIQPSELAAPVPAAITQDQIQQAVEQQFGKESAQVRDAIVNHVAQSVFDTAQDLQAALEQLRQMELDILMKLVLDHNQASQSNEQMFQTALNNFDHKRQEERQSFFTQFSQIQGQLKAAFNL